MPIKLKMRTWLELYSTLLYELVNVVGFACYNSEGNLVHPNLRELVIWTL